MKRERLLHRHDVDHFDVRWLVCNWLLELAAMAPTTVAASGTDDVHRSDSSGMWTDSLSQLTKLSMNFVHVHGGVLEFTETRIAALCPWPFLTQI